MSDNNNDTKQPLNKDFREPKIRFPEFIKPWGHHKLGDLCDVYTGGEAPEDSIQTKVAINEYKYPIYSNGIGENALWGYSKSYRIDVPAITFSSIGTLGYPEIREPYFTPIIRLKVIIPKIECDLYYLKCSLSCKPFPYNAGGIPNINAKTLKDISLIFTSDLGEQEKIGLLFRNLDSLIDINRHECEALKKYKEGIVNDWFKKEGRGVELGKLVSSKPSGLLTSHFKENSGDYPVYDASGTKYTKIDFFNTNVDSISIIKYGSGCGRTFLTEGPHSVLGTMNEMIPNSNEDLEYVYAYTLSIDFRRTCKKYTETGTTPNLYFSDYSTAKLYYPEKEERDLFVSAFSLLEQVESIYDMKIKLLYKVKSFLLKNMFI